MSTTLAALVGYITWTFALITALELARTYLVLVKGYPATQFKADGADISPIMGRLCRAHANCVEGFPIFGGLLLLALAAGHTKITDPLALYLLAARLGQSLTHLVSGGAGAVNIRFAFFVAQLAIAGIWIARFIQAIVPA